MANKLHGAAAPLLALALAALVAGQAWALSAQEVLGLKRAGVSDETIQKMIETEMSQAGRGRVGRYTVRQSGGGEVVVYEATSPRGVEEYPVEMDPAWLGSERMRLLLGAKPGQDVPLASHGGASQAQPAGKGRTKHKPGSYTLLLESHRQLAQAQQKAKEMNAAGIDPVVESVDLGAKGHWYRVLHGRFKDRQSAQAKGEKLREVGGVESFTILGR